MAEKIKVLIEVEPGTEVTIKPLAAEVAKRPQLAAADAQELKLSATKTATATATGGPSPDVDGDVDIDF